MEKQYQGKEETIQIGDWNGPIAERGPTGGELSSAHS